MQLFLIGLILTVRVEHLHLFFLIAVNIVVILDKSDRSLIVTALLLLEGDSTILMAFIVLHLYIFLVFIVV